MAMIEPPGAAPPSTPVPTPAAISGAACLMDKEGADQVEVDGGPDLVGIGPGDGTHVHGSPGIGEQDVEPAPLGRGGGHRRRHLVLDRHVGDHVGGGSPGRGRRRPGRVGGGRLENADRGAQALLGPPADGHMGAVADQTDGGTETDPASAPGDQGRQAADAPLGASAVSSPFGPPVVHGRPLGFRRGGGTCYRVSD